MLTALPQQNGEVETELTTFVARRNWYAFYCLEQIPCNRHKKGNTASEVNHLSVLSYLNDGFRSSNLYPEHPTLLIQDILKRQHSHIIMTNKRLFKGLVNSCSKSDFDSILESARNLLTALPQQNGEVETMWCTARSVHHIF